MSSSCAASALECRDRLAGPRAHSQQLHGERQDVVAPLAQGRQPQREHVETIVEIFAEPAGGDFLAQPAVGGRQHPQLQRDGGAAAQAFDLALLQYPQQFRLQAERHFGDLIQQQGAALGLFKLSRVRGVRAGEGAALVAEQNGLEHVLRDGRAVHSHERAAAARGNAVDEAREHFLAGAGLADDEHGAVAGGDAARQLQQSLR